MGPPPSLYGEADKKALGKLWIASIIFLAIFVVGIGTDIVVFSIFSKFFTLSRPVGGLGTPPSFHFSSAFYADLIVSSAVIGAIDIIALLLVRSSFKTLETVDRSQFHMPSILTIVALIALPLIFIGFGIEFSGIPALMSSISQTSPGTTPSLVSPAFGNFFTGSIITGFGGLIGLIGFIGGIMLGLWRVGGRYDSTLIKASAILLIIPGLDILVPILMVIGVWKSRNKVSMSTAAPNVTR